MQFITGKDSQYTEIILLTMLALCLMLSGTYYAQNYASIIGWCLAVSALSIKVLLNFYFQKL